MAITIDFGPEKEALVWEKAARFGQKADEYIYDLVSERLDEPETDNNGKAMLAPKKEPTLAELFAGRTGLVNSEGRFNYSDHTGRAYTESLVKEKQLRDNAQEG
jgi:hypothetical protein